MPIQHVWSALCDKKKVLDSHFMFCLPEYTGDGAVYPCELLEWLDTLKDGAVIHINSVFDYHY